MSRRLVLLAALLTLLTACGRSAPTSYYLLENSPKAVQADALPAKSLRVGQVNVPEYLDRNGIVSRVNGKSRLIIAEFHAWAEPLSHGVRRVIQETLTPPLLAGGVNVLPSGDEESGDFTLLVEVQRLDGNFNDKAVLEARWSLRNRDDAILGRGIYAAEEAVRGKSYDVLVNAESSLVRRMAQYLSEKLPPLMAGKKP